MEWREKSHLPVEEGLANVKMAKSMDCCSLKAKWRPSIHHHQLEW